jgi:hypothetical protein
MKKRSILTCLQRADESLMQNLCIGNMTVMLESDIPLLQLRSMRYYLAAGGAP